MITGSHTLFGNWDIKKGVRMTPHHEGEHLVWQAQVSVPEGFKLDYRFGIVDEKLNIIKWESGEPRQLTLPVGPPDGAVIDVLDGWQVLRLETKFPRFCDYNCWPAAPDLSDRISQM